MAVKVRKLRTDKDGKAVYGLRIYHQGEQKKISVGTRAAAEKLKKEVELELAKGNLGLIEQDAPSFEELAADFLSLKKATKSNGTYLRYRAIITLHLRKSFLNKPIDTINRGDVRNEILAYHRKKVSKSSLEAMHTVISGVFNYAMDDELIKHSPSVGVMKRLDIPKDNPEINPFGQEQFEEFLKKVKQDYHDIYLTLYYTGMRVGELLALQWSDVDLTGKKIKINKSAKNQVIRNHTKTYMTREIDIADTLHTLLIKLKQQDKKDRLSKGEKQGPVFHKNGRLVAQQTLWSNLSNTCKDMGLGNRTIHDIRHTTASLLLARLVPLTYVSKLLGHSSPRITLERYSHYIPAENKGAVNVLDGGDKKSFITAKI